MEEEETVYEGWVKSVRETWPLQMTLVAKDREIEAIVSPEARIRSRDGLLLEGSAAPQPAPGMVVKVKGKNPGSNRRFEIDSVEIRELGPVPGDESKPAESSGEAPSTQEPASIAGVPMQPPSPD